MKLDFLFFLNSVLFGVGLAMDAFSVSLVNGLAEPKMKPRRMLTIAAVFAVFQALMPLIGWVFVHSLVVWFSWISGIIPWISLVLLSLIGGKMIADAYKPCEGGSECGCGLGFFALAAQGVATSIDALSVGFTIAEYPLLPALLSSCIIGAVTFGICLFGVWLGKHFGTRFSHKAEILGGVLLILIGIEIFLTGIF
ncbi:MAG: manganese efflux pump [Clostridia bacterium]|nr:manganese efflux pump [Clostridia bacterium]